MSKFSSIYICQQCGFRSSQFLGKCPECGTWNSLVESLESGVGSQVENKRSRLKTLATSNSIINLAEVEKEHYDRLSTNLEEFDRVLGGGIVPGSVVLVSGEPGIGKSTLLLQLALGLNQKLDARGLKIDKEVRGVKLENNQTSNFQHQDLSSNFQHPISKVLYVAGEESARQIKIRAERIKKGANLAILNENDVDAICGMVNEEKGSQGDKGGKGDWGLVIVDSIQTLQTSDLNGVAGSVGQVRECAQRLQQIAKKLHVPIFLVGHVTKDGTVAGPKTLEHLVDVVLSLEGDPTSSFRILRATKNRFGSTDEVGIFEMNDKGMSEVTNPSKMFLSTKVKAPGSVVAVTLNGVRPILVEVQALVTKSFLPMPRRTGSGIDNNRLQLLVAVLQSRMKLPLFDKDIFVNMTGGLKIIEPSTDLAICLAIISSLKESIVDSKTAVIGEVGLLGEIREVRGMEKRVAEAKKLGFTKIISPENAGNLQEAVTIISK